jgi:biotin carboxyl carrier protein
MELEIQIHSGSKTSAHKFELSTPASAVQGRTEAASSGAKNRQLEPRASPKPHEGSHARPGNPQSLQPDRAKPGARHKAARQVKDGTQPEPEKLLHFFSDGEKLIADGEEISPGVYSILIDGRSYEAHVSKRPGDADGYSSPYVVAVGLRHYLVEIRDPRRWRREGPGVQTKGPQEIVAPMPGRIVKVLVSENQDVVRDQGLVVIEAMKMQNEIRAPRAGRVERIYAEEATGVEAGARLLRFV